MAFVSGVSLSVRAPVTAAAVSPRTSAFAGARVAAAPVSRRAATLRMVGEDFENLPTKPEGFTPNAEVWNGRFAMIGFVLALGTQVLNPAHPTIAQQVAALNPAQLAANAATLFGQ
ncbi:hypothetical protein MMPV_008652 [Pyropia vietnamensis]